MSIYTLLFAGTTPIGALVVGALAERIGVQDALATMAGICLLGVGSALVYHHHARHRLLGAGSASSRGNQESASIA
jgi:hypothetical protein